MLKALAARDVPIPPHIDIYYMDKEIAASDMTALEVGAVRLHCGCLQRGGVQVCWKEQRARAPPPQNTNTPTPTSPFPAGGDVSG